MKKLLLFFSLFSLHAAEMPNISGLQQELNTLNNELGKLSKKLEATQHPQVTPPPTGHLGPKGGQQQKIQVLFHGTDINNAQTFFNQFGLQGNFEFLKLQDNLNIIQPAQKGIILVNFSAGRQRNVLPLEQDLKKSIDFFDQPIIIMVKPGTAQNLQPYDGPVAKIAQEKIADTDSSKYSDQENKKRMEEALKNPKVANIKGFGFWYTPDFTIIKQEDDAYQNKIDQLKKLLQ
ncbi:MAG: hypothetical protein AB7R69_00580 [Candidatus Babeliales bacterium]